jgi:hypothetical protein
LVWLLLETEVLLADFEAEVAALLETAGDRLDMVMTEEGDGGACQKPVKASAWKRRIGGGGRREVVLVCMGCISCDCMKRMKEEEESIGKYDDARDSGAGLVAESRRDIDGVPEDAEGKRAG